MSFYFGEKIAITIVISQKYVSQLKFYLLRCWHVLVCDWDVLSSLCWWLLLSKRPHGWSSESSRGVDVMTSFMISASAGRHTSVIAVAITTFTFFFKSRPISRAIDQSERNSISGQIIVKSRSAPKHLRKKYDSHARPSTVPICAALPGVEKERNQCQ